MHIYIRRAKGEMVFLFTRFILKRVSGIVLAPSTGADMQGGKRAMGICARPLQNPVSGSLFFLANCVLC